MYRIGIDVGGTFTDLVAVDDFGRSASVKVASTPADPSVGALDGLELLAGTLGRELARLLAQTERIVHGTTVATNALIEYKGAKVGLLTTDATSSRFAKGSRTTATICGCRRPSSWFRASSGSAFVSGCAQTAGSRRR